MPNTSIVVSSEFLTAAAALEKDAKAKLFKILCLLAEDFRHPSLQCKRVQGSRADLFECRVDQSIRLIYNVARGRLRCVYIGHHDDALRFAVMASPVSVDDIECVSEPSVASEGVIASPDMEEGILTELSHISRLLEIEEFGNHATE
jgi:mRNA-degrading endonuclease YafQ of YafQ-DinJ toxin-antitoxin module